MSIKDITVVITSFKSEDKIRKCLNSIDNQCTVINVENSNSQDHKNKIEKEFKNVKCILTGGNLGYARANNIGIKNSKTKYVLILNPDTKLFPETLKNFLNAAQKHPDFAIMAPNIAISESKNKILNSPVNSLTSVESVKGYAMFLNLQQFKNIGFFDENFFIYLEEIDLCKRLIKNGKKIYIDSKIEIFHEGGESHDISINFEMELSRNWHWMWSKFYFQKKYHGYLYSLMGSIPRFLSTIFKIALYSLLFNKKKVLIYFFRLRGITSAILGQKSWYRPKIKN